MATDLPPWYTVYSPSELAPDLALAQGQGL